MFSPAKIREGGSIRKRRAEATPLQHHGLRAHDDHGVHDRGIRGYSVEEFASRERDLREGGRVGANSAMNCDRIAPFYRTVERLSFGGKLEACRTAFVDELKDCRSALLCGDGDGRFLAQLLRANRKVRVDCVDLSAKMIELARRRVMQMGPEFLGRVRFFVSDLRGFNADERSYDLIGAHFFLDCFDDAGAACVAERFAKWAEPGARIALSEFRRPAHGIQRLLGSATIRGLYAAFRVTTGLRVTRLPEYEIALAQAGFAEERRTSLAGGLLHAAIWRKRG
jgi:ubiquinone/menaquinone biosynthesis C-methylase UbiE